MTELEILAELKISYINIEDIIDNASFEQVGLKDTLIQAKNAIEEKYAEVYKIAEDSNANLYYKGHKISNCVCFDYMENNFEYYMILDVDTKENLYWYGDYRFQTE
jgi:hypothetical protein